MPLPKVTQTIKDGGLGLIEGDIGAIHVKIGVCSSGTNNVLTFYSDPDRLKTDLGQGPLVDAAIYHLQVAGGPVGIMRVNASIVGTSSAVTATRAAPGDSTGTVTVAGAPNDAYEFVVEITKTGAVGAGEFRYSLDGGDNFSDAIAIPSGGAYAIPGTNVTATFANAAGPVNFRIGDLYTWRGTAPGYSVADAGAALDALRTTYATSRFSFIHLVGQAATSAGAAALATAVDAKMAAEEIVFRYLFALVEWPEDTDAAAQTSVAAFTSQRVVPLAGFCEVVANNRSMKRSIGSVIAARISQQDIRRDLARTRPDGEGGPVKGVSKIFRDEFTTPGLDDYGFTTLRTFPGTPGFYVTNGRLRVAAGSDFKFLQFRRLMDRACTINYTALFPHLNDDVVRVKSDGTIDELDARNLEAEINAQLTADLTNNDRVSNTSVTIDRLQNILSTQTLKTKVRIQPKGYAKFIETEIGFENPALRPS